MKPNSIAPTINTRRLTWLYILALGMVGLLTVVGQLAVQVSLMRLQDDARIVNLAGRQRMLSQRLPLLVYTFQFNDRLILEKSLPPENRQVSRQALIHELSDLLTAWDASHRGLQSGSLALGLPGRNSSAVAEAFQQIEPHFQALRKTIGDYADAHQSDEPSLTLSQQQHFELVQHSKGFLAGMDKIVSLYESEASARVTQLKLVERSLLAATLLVLVLEGLFIFSPAISSLRRAFDELTKTSNQLTLAKQSAEAANVAKTEFLTRVSHELRTPLHGILGMLDLVKRGSLRPSQRSRIGLASQASRSLQRLVDDLLDVSGIESGKTLALQESVFELHQLIHGVVELMSPIAGRKGLQTGCEIASDVPHWVHIDGDRLRQALTNLFQNAIRYTDQGHVQCRVRIASKTSNETTPLIANVVFEVSDTGRGIALEDQQRIFESFVRLVPSDIPQDFGPGLGLGLPITAGLIQQMGGRVDLESQLQQGTTIRFTLPLRLVDESHAETAEHTDALNKSTKKFKGPRILVVDDSRINRILMREFLKKLRCRIKSTSSLESARRIIERSQPDIVLLDRHLPDGDGLSFARGLRESGKRVPVIFLVTADIQLMKNDALTSEPIAGVLQKPLSLDQLQRSLKAYLVEGSTENESVVTTDQEDEKLKVLKVQLRSDLRNRLPQELSELCQHIQASHFRMIQIVAHRLKGSSANVHWDDLAEQASRLEIAAEQNQIQSVWIAYEQLAKVADNHRANT